MQKLFKKFHLIQTNIQLKGLNLLISIESQTKKVVVVVVVVVVFVAVSLVVVVIVGHRNLTLKFGQNRVNNK